MYCFPFLSSDYFNFRLQCDAEPLLYRSCNVVFQVNDFARTCASCGIDNHQRLLFIDPGIALSAALPSALLDQPCSRNQRKQETKGRPGEIGDAAALGKDRNADQADQQVDQLACRSPPAAQKDARAWTKRPKSGKAR